MEEQQHTIKIEHGIPNNNNFGDKILTKDKHQTNKTLKLNRSDNSIWKRVKPSRKSKIMYAAVLKLLPTKGQWAKGVNQMPEIFADYLFGIFLYM